MNEPMAHETNSGHRVRIGLLSLAALGAGMLMVPTANAATPMDSHNDPGTCTYVTSSWAYIDPTAQTIAISVTFRNNGDKSTNCRAVIKWGADSSCLSIAAGKDRSTTVYRTPPAAYEKMKHC